MGSPRSKKCKQQPVNHKNSSGIPASKMPVTPKRPAPPPPIPNLALLKTYFDRVDQNKNGMISPEELGEALTNGTENYPFQIATIKAMMNSFNVGNSREIDFEHFGHVWRYVNNWQNCFKRFDVDKSGAICAQELNSALTKVIKSWNFGIVRTMLYGYALTTFG